MKPLRFFALSICILGLSACQTFEGVKKDFANLELPSLNGTSSSASDDLVYSGACPRVEAVADLKAVSEFASEDDHSEPNLVSEVKIDRVQSSCSYDENSVTVDLKMDFDGRIGPQSRTVAGNAPFFSYPFFVAVTSANGTILAKEIFSANMSYNAGESTKRYTEKLRQIIPIENRDRGANYKILVGFQLSPDQLAYNRLTIEQEKLAAQAEAQAQPPAQIKTIKVQEQAAKETYVGAPVSITP